MGRLIFLVDMNAFFISCETARNTALKGKPAAVAGDPKKRSGIILAANYEARKFNIKTTMLLHEAKELCPEIIVVPPDHKLYEQKSKEVMNILSRYTPVIQQNSIDEAWMDLTGCEKLFGSPLEIAESIMVTISEELDLWCSIGISENKFLAKMGSEMKKPQGITELYVKDIGKKLWPLPVRKMYGIGKQTEQRLKDYAIYKIGDIANSNPELLKRNFGKYGGELYKLSNGIDDSPVTPNPIYDSKSISRSTTLPVDTDDIEYIKYILMGLAEEVGYEARKHGYKGKTISISIKYEDFESVIRQKTVASTYLTKDIYENSLKLLRANKDKNKRIRLLGLGLSNFDGDESEQLSIFNLFEENRDIYKQETIEKTIDKIRERFGNRKIIRGSMLKSDKDS
ncbi:MAG TPA: DNA polymerase IV [Bacillota bacterium]|nr:DNA polymerase IV [Bacillota bacterium]HPL53319.1 DNA polymerase IV [Bacillota bacterium]